MQCEKDRVAVTDDVVFQYQKERYDEGGYQTPGKSPTRREPGERAS